MSPIRAIMNTRDARGALSKSELVEFAGLLNGLLSNDPELPQPIVVTSLNFDGATEEDVPLTWLLSARARSFLDRSVDSLMAQAAERESRPTAARKPVKAIVCALSKRRTSPTLQAC